MRALLLDGTDLSRASEYLFSSTGDLNDRLVLDAEGYTDSVYRVLSALSNRELVLNVAPGFKVGTSEVHQLLRLASVQPGVVLEVDELRPGKRKRKLADAGAGLAGIWKKVEWALHRGWLKPLARHLKREALDLERRDAASWPPGLRLDDTLVQQLEAEIQDQWGPSGKTRRGLDVREFLNRNVAAHYRVALEHANRSEYLPSASRELLYALADEAKRGKTKRRGQLKPVGAPSLQERESTSDVRSLLFRAEYDGAAVLKAAESREELVELAISRRVGPPDEASPGAVLWRTFLVAWKLSRIVTSIENCPPDDLAPPLQTGLPAAHEAGGPADILSLATLPSDFRRLRRGVKWLRIQARWSADDGRDLTTHIARLASTPPATPPPPRE